MGKHPESGGEMRGRLMFPRTLMLNAFRRFFDAFLVQDARMP